MSKPPVFWVCLGLVGVVIGWTGSKVLLDKVEVTTDKKDTLRIAADPFSGYFSVRDGVKVPGLDLKYSNILDQKERFEKLEKGELDVILTTVDQVVQRPNFTIIGIVDTSNGADALVLNNKEYSDLTNLNVLNSYKGKKIVYSGGTPSEHLLNVLSKKFDIKLSNFKIVESVDSAEALKYLENDSNVVAAVLWQPDVAKAEAKEYISVASSKYVPKAIVDVMVSTEPTIKKKDSELSSFIKGFYRFKSDLSDGDLEEYVSKDGRISENEAGIVVRGIKFFSLSETNQWLTNTQLSQIIADTGAVSKYFGKTTYPVAIDGSFVADANRALASIDPALAQVPTPVAVPSLSAEVIKKGSSIGDVAAKNIAFESGSATLAPQATQSLKDLAKSLGDFSPDAVGIIVSGYSSRTGSSPENLILSNQRAGVVANALKAYGVRANIVSLGYGDTTPLPGTNPASVANQRTEIRINKVK